MSIIKYQRPSLSTWPGFNRLTNLQDELDRFFDTPFAALTQGTSFNGAWTPALDVYEDMDSFVVKAELPGMKKDENEVSLHDGILCISGERKAETKTEDAEVYRAERFVGRFQRSVVLPATVAADKVKAAYTDGVLTITLPKTEEAKPKKIDVSVN